MPLFLKPIFFEKIWGGNKLNQFNYDIPSEQTGECWGISAHPNGKNMIENGQYAGQTLDQVWNEHRELFGDFPSKDFPLLCKIVDAEEDAEIILGTSADSKETFENKIKEDAVLDAVERIKVKPGEFYFIPAGMLHSIGSGVLVYETMQSSDISYRVYDYERNRTDGSSLEVSKALDVIQFTANAPTIVPETTIVENHKRSQIVSNDFFTMVKWEISGTLNYMKPREFCLISVLEGRGQVITDGEIFKLEKGSNFILTSEDLDSVFEGEFTLIISYI